MSIIETDNWLENQFFEPVEICNQVVDSFQGLTSIQIYHLLVSKGMYTPNFRSYQIFKEMKEQNIWEYLKTLEEKYKSKWRGVNIPIYIFPAKSDIFNGSRKNGFTFPDKIFLFISDVTDLKEIEALFVHEYHHACRLSNTNKPIEENTLLDSIFMEGLAEYAVLVECGEKYLSEWTKFNKSAVRAYYHNVLKDQLNVSIQNPLHDKLLYGKGFRSIPLVGYAVGFDWILQISKNKELSLKDTINKSSEYFYNLIENLELG